MKITGMKHVLLYFLQKLRNSTMNRNCKNTKSYNSDEILRQMLYSKQIFSKFISKINLYFAQMLQIGILFRLNKTENRKIRCIQIESNIYSAYRQIYMVTKAKLTTKAMVLSLQLLKIYINSANIKVHSYLAISLNWRLHHCMIQCTQWQCLRRV